MLISLLYEKYDGQDHSLSIINDITLAEFQKLQSEQRSEIFWLYIEKIANITPKRECVDCIIEMIKIQNNLQFPLHSIYSKVSVFELVLCTSLEGFDAEIFEELPEKVREKILDLSDVSVKLEGKEFEVLLNFVGCLSKSDSIHFLHRAIEEIENVEELFLSCLVLLFEDQESYLFSKFHIVHHSWPEMLWKVILILYERGYYVYDVLCNSRNIFFTQKHLFDLRKDPKFVNMIQSSLASDKGHVRKRAAIFFKALLEFSKQNLESSEEYSPLIWAKSNSAAWDLKWKSFFVIYETLQEANSNLIAPALPFFENLISETNGAFLRSEWWGIITKLAFGNDSKSARRMVLEHIIGLDVSHFLGMQDADDFLFDQLVVQLDNATLYVTVEMSTLLCDFGQKVVKFWRCYFENIGDPAKKVLLE